MSHDADRDFDAGSQANAWMHTGGANGETRTMGTTLKIVKADSKPGQAWIEELLRRGEDILDARVLDRAGRLVRSVREGGDRALLKAVRRFDGARPQRVRDLRHAPRSEPADALPAGFEEALERAIAAVKRYHEAQKSSEVVELRTDGVFLREIHRPLRRVGLYIPGGRAAYPSTVLMTAIPAKVAGVEEIVVVTPPRMLDESAALRHTLARLGIHEVWGVGGAHAIAALAYGTETIRRVDKIVGPGNAWVTAAKHLVSSDVAIEGVAGPSEVVIVVDTKGGAPIDPDWVAADLLAQAEHDPQAMALLITDDARYAKDVGKALRRRVPRLATSKTAAESIVTRGGALIVGGMDEALNLVDRIAPEHLQLVGEGAEALAERVRNAGAIFVGASTPEVFGDYVAGPSHVLPTAGTARFTSALGVEDFMRRSHIVKVEAAAAPRLAQAAAIFADVEGLPAHAVSARLRLGGAEGD